MHGQKQSKKQKQSKWKCKCDWKCKAKCKFIVSENVKVIGNVMENVNS